MQIDQIGLRLYVEAESPANAAAKIIRASERGRYGVERYRTGDDAFLSVR